MSLFAKKPLDQLLAQAEGKGLKRTLGAGNLVALGIGAIIGAGLFVRTAAAAGQAAGPAVTISFIIAAIGLIFSIQSEFWLGILLGIIAAFTSSFFTSGAFSTAGAAVAPSGFAAAVSI